MGKFTGPAVILSFALAGVCSSVYAVCFAELAAMVGECHVRVFVYVYVYV